MSIRLQCDNPDCQKTIQAKDDLAGKRIKCPRCKRILNVPESAAAAISNDETPSVKPVDVKELNPPSGTLAKGMLKGAAGGMVLAGLLFLGAIGLMWVTLAGLDMLSGGKDLGRLGDLSIRFRTWDDSTPASLGAAAFFFCALGGIIGAYIEYLDTLRLWAIPQDLEAPEALPRLLAALKHKNETVQAAACDALGQLGQKAEPAISAMLEFLESKSLAKRLAATKAIGKIGVGAQKAIPRLNRLLSDEDPRVCEAAQESLRRLGAPSKKH